ncbi:hypothetical protein [Tetragenococcus halophilus]|uniref:Uncharacterized protein n=1 Tax=Tetragenococcus halophilus TaxID=51669 RepID=A0AB35HQS5_TETHA|nr:hypothetical protein [Tetragenococcus halophilus]MCO8298658.1 hypothetical protein [Tetragenococcus halophilus]
MIEFGLTDNQKIVLDYLKSQANDDPFANIHFLWDQSFDYCMGIPNTEENIEVFEAFLNLDGKLRFEVLQEYGRWGINGGK